MSNLARQIAHPIFHNPFLLLCFWKFHHRTHTACADIDGARHTIDLDAAALHVQHKTTARAALRETHIIAMHRLALTYFTTT